MGDVEAERPLAQEPARFVGLDDALRPLGSRYLGDASQVAAAMAAVAAQGTAKPAG